AHLGCLHVADVVDLVQSLLLRRQSHRGVDVAVQRDLDLAVRETVDDGRVITAPRLLPGDEHGETLDVDDITLRTLEVGDAELEGEERGRLHFLAEQRERGLRELLPLDEDVCHEDPFQRLLMAARSSWPTPGGVYLELAAAVMSSTDMSPEPIDWLVPPCPSADGAMTRAGTSARISSACASSSSRVVPRRGVAGTLRSSNFFSL